MTRKQINDAVFWIAAAVLVSITALHVAVARGLFADGAYFLLEMLKGQGFWNYDKVRIFAQIIDQYPVLAAIGSGTPNTKFLARVYTLALELPVLALYLLALWKVRRNTVLFGSFILIVVVIHLNVGFLSSGEYNLLYALTAAALALLLQEEEFTSLDGILLSLIAFVCTRVYEAIVFLGPLLFIACMLRLNLRKPRPAAALTIMFSAFWFACGSAIAYWSILFPRDPTNFAGAASLSLLLRNRQLILSCVLAASYAGFILLTPRAWRMAMMALFAAALVAMAFPSTWSGPKFHYYSRTGAGMILFGIGLVLICFRFSSFWPARTSQQSLRWPALLLAGPLVSLIVLSIPDVYHTLAWRRFRHSIEAEVNTKTGLVPLAQTNISPDDIELLAFSWTFPSMSLLFRAQASHAIVLNPNPDAWQPFDPAQNLPDLHQYYWK